MTMKELMKESPENLREIQKQMILRGNMVAATGIDYVIKFANKRVKVVKGRKVPKGTEGICFWMGSQSYAKYADPWGLYTSFRCGIKDDFGEVHWTAIDNIELANEK